MALSICTYACKVAIVALVVGAESLVDASNPFQDDSASRKSCPLRTVHGTSLLQKKNTNEKTFLIEEDEEDVPLSSYQWQRKLRSHEGKSDEEIYAMLPLYLLQIQFDALAEDINTTNDESLVKSTKKVVEDIVQHNGAGNLTKEEIEDFENHTAEAMKEDVKLAQKEGRNVSKEELAKMLKQELVNQQPVVTQAEIDKINSKHLGWQAGKDELNRHMTQQDYQDGLGLEVPENDTDLEDEPPDLKKVVLSNNSNNSVVLLGLRDPPREFDGRTAWPKCAKTIGRVRDQGKCGSCWAQAVTGVFEDRLCIASEGEFTAEISAADMAACDNANGGCNGGNPSKAVSWLIRTGVVTGGDFPDRGDGKTCYPYPIIDKDSRKHFSSQVRTPQCYSSCQEKNYPRSYNEDKYKAAGHAYRVGSQSPARGNHEQEFMKLKVEISTKGSVVMMYAATRDHMSYKSGVWNCPGGRPSHGVKCIGYGVDPQAGNYILCVNSWNVHWGDKGLFKMKYPGNGCLYQMEAFPVSWSGQPSSPTLCPCATMPSPCCGDGKCQSGKNGPENEANCPVDCPKKSLSLLDLGSRQMTQAGRRRRRSETGATMKDLKTVKDTLQEVKDHVDKLKADDEQNEQDFKKSLSKMETEFEDELGKTKSAISKEMKDLKSHVDHELKKATGKNGHKSANDNDNSSSNAGDNNKANNNDNNDDDNNNSNNNEDSDEDDDDEDDGNDNDDNDGNDDDNDDNDDNNNDDDDGSDKKESYCGRPWPTTTTTTTTTTSTKRCWPPWTCGNNGGNKWFR